MKNFRKSYSAIVALVAMAMILMASTAYAADATTASRSTDFQGKVDIGGYGLNIQIHGQRHDGSPTVVFENGNGDDDGVWYQKGVAQAVYEGTVAGVVYGKPTQIVTYDRIGIGGSDKPASPDYSAKAEATRLHTLLKNAGVNPPYILVGHSIGGLYIREFQYLWPDEVKGVVFVDSAYEYEENTLFPDPDFTAADREAIMEDDLSNGTGIPVELSYQDMQGVYKEMDAARAADKLRWVPITVLSAGNHGYPPIMGDAEPKWASLQNKISMLSNNSVHVLSADSSHYIMLDDPKTTISMIENMISRVRCD